MKITKKTSEKPVVLTEPIAVGNYFLNKWQNFDGRRVIYALALGYNSQTLGEKAIQSSRDFDIKISTWLPVDFAIKCGAPKLLIVTNHIEKDLHPSSQEISAVKEIGLRSRMLNIDFEDYIILARNSKGDPALTYFSLAKEGLMKEINKQVTAAINVLNPNTFESKALTAVTVACRERHNYFNQQGINDKLIKVVDKLYIKYFDPIEIKEFGQMRDPMDIYYRTR